MKQVVSHMRTRRDQPRPINKYLSWEIGSDYRISFLTKHITYLLATEMAWFYRIYRFSKFLTCKWPRNIFSTLQLSAHLIVSLFWPSLPSPNKSGRAKLSSWKCHKNIAESGIQRNKFVNTYHYADWYLNWAALYIFAYFLPVSPDARICPFGAQRTIFTEFWWRDRSQRQLGSTLPHSFLLSSLRSSEMVMSHMTTCLSSPPDASLLIFLRWFSFVGAG